MAMVGAAAGMSQSVKNEMGPMAGGLNSKTDPREELPTFIYEYFLKSGKRDLANALLKSDLGVKTIARSKTSPGSVNGVDGNMGDSKDGMPTPDLPATHLLPDSSFLQEWWTVFWDFWALGKGQMKQNPVVTQYVNQRQMQRQQQEAMMMRNGIMPNMTPMNGAMRGMMPNGMANGMNPAMNGEAVRRGAMLNNGRNMAQMQGLRNMQDQQRDGPEMDMGTQGRTQSPGSSDNAPSPKRQRVDAPFGGQPMGPGGRPTSMATQVNGLGPNGMMQNGLDPNTFANAQFNGMAQQNFQRMNAGQLQMSDAMKMNGMQGRGPMMGQAPDDFNMPMALPGGANAAGVMQRSMNGNNPNQQGGALADYQMQLMLLEQQNKKRLLMARQEQEVIAQTGNPGPGTQAMINQGSNDQMRRGTPGVGQGSPRPDGSVPATRGSPAPGFDPSQIPANYQQMAQMKSLSENMMNGPNGQMMRPPGYTGPMNPQMQEMIRQRMAAAGGALPGQVQQVPGNPAGPNQIDNGQQRNPMPPPQAPGNGNTGRTQPSSPRPEPAPPTPGQGTKGNAKAKKETKEKKKPAKKNTATTGATPSTEAERPPTPTPSTPITPVAHNNPFGSKAGAAQPVNPQQQGGPQQEAGQQENQPAAPFGEDLQDFNPISFVGSMGDNSDVLEGFDFDSLLNMDQTTGPGFDIGDPTQFPFGDAVEMNTGDQ